MALVIKRKRGEAIRIGPHITVTIGETRGSYTAIHIDAPKSLPVWRAEIKDFHAGGNDDVRGGSLQAPADDSASDGVPSSTRHRTPRAGND